MADYSFQTGVTNTFSIVDYVIFGLVLAFSAGIGVFYAIKDRNNQSTKTFLMAGGNMSAYPVALSLLASFMSAITLLGTPAEMYNYTTMYWWIGLSYLFVIFCSAHLFLPVFYRLGTTSVYEYLEKRFNKPVRTAASCTFMLQMTLYMAIVLYAPSLALNAVTGFSLWGSIIAVGLVCTFYTTIGGMKAVLWTDTFQVFMMFAGLLAILIKGSIELGGFSKAWEIANENQRVQFDDFDPNPAVRHSFWALVVGGTFTWTAIYGANQAQIQRAMTCSTLGKAKLAMWINFPGLTLIMLLSCLIGIVVFAFYSQCDPITFNLITANDQLLPLYVMDVMGKLTGFPGLFLACIFSGCLSTISSGVNSLAAVLLEDIVKEYFFKNMKDKTATFVSKAFAVLFGLICIGLTYVASLLGGVLQAALALFGVIGGPLLGLFTLGMFFPWANSIGAFVGLITSLTFMFWISVGAQVYPQAIWKAPISTIGCNFSVATTVSQATTLVSDITTTATQAAESDWRPDHELYRLSYMWYSATAVGTVVIVGMLVSLCTGRTKARDIDPRLMCPFFDIAFPFLPEKIRKPLRFGVNYDSLKGEGQMNHVIEDNIKKTGADMSYEVPRSDTEKDEKGSHVTAETYDNKVFSAEEGKNPAANGEKPAANGTVDTRL